jgi:hypothetical protein
VHIKVENRNQVESNYLTPSITFFFKKELINHVFMMPENSHLGLNENRDARFPAEVKTSSDNWQN